MAYTNKSNIINFIDRNTLIQLTDDNSIGEVNDEVVNYHIDLAQKEIDSYLRGRYPANMADADVPEEISDMCTKIAVYSLYRRRLQLTMPETVKNDYKMCIKRLEKIQSGKVTPFESEDEPETIKTNKTVYSKTFNSTVWSKY